MKVNEILMLIFAGGTFMLMFLKFIVDLINDKIKSSPRLQLVGYFFNYCLILVIQLPRQPELYIIGC